MTAIPQEVGPEPVCWPSKVMPVVGSVTCPCLNPRTS
jgi:hypothetical protein